MTCNRCAGTGFLNIEQVDNGTVAEFRETKEVDVILAWIEEKNLGLLSSSCCCHIAPPCNRCVEYAHDVQVCDCCGDGDNWYGEPGEHGTETYPINSGVPLCV